MAETKAKSPAYSVRFTAPTLTGSIKNTEFHSGFGILDRYSIASARPDICRQASLDWAPGFGDFLLEELARYWGERGAKVEKMTEAEAMKLRDRLQKDPTGHLPKPKKPKKDAATSKAKGKAAGKSAGAVPPHQREK